LNSEAIKTLASHASHVQAKRRPRAARRLAAFFVLDLDQNLDGD
jgi:hypothetical protein